MGSGGRRRRKRQKKTNQEDQDTNSVGSQNKKLKTQQSLNPSITSSQRNTENPKTEQQSKELEKKTPPKFKDPQLFLFIKTSHVKKLKSLIPIIHTIYLILNVNKKLTLDLHNRERLQQYLQSQRKAKKRHSLPHKSHLEPNNDPLNSAYLFFKD